MGTMRGGDRQLADVVDDGSGKAAFIPAVKLVGADGVAAGSNSYPLATNQAIPANTGTTPVTGLQRGVYVWDAQFTGTGPLKLQALGADGATWRDVASLSASGTLAGEVRIGANATVRLFSATALTAVSSSLS